MSTTVARQSASASTTGVPVLRVEELRIERAGPDASTSVIVSGVGLSLCSGETIGIVGESGSGKSMTARAITGLLPPALRASGTVSYGGRNLLQLAERDWRAIRGREIGLVLQDPFTMLNPVLRCGAVLTESLRSERQTSRSERRAEAVRRLLEVGISDSSVVDRYPFQLSGGMRQRVALAAALARDPQVLIADEPSTALDVRTQSEILALIKRIQEARGMGLILITHDLRVAFEICERIHVLYAGSLVEVASSHDLEREPMHPYSQGLLLSEAPVDRRVRELGGIPGSVPRADEVAGRCVFEPRCRWAAGVCREGAPDLRSVSPAHLSACARIDEIRVQMASFRASVKADSVPPPPRSGEAPLILVRDLRKTFQQGGREIQALSRVSIEVGPHESVGLVGESGSGKTTLARSLMGLEQPSEGSITIDGIDASDWSRVRPADRRHLRGTVQVVFQDPYSSLNPMRSVGWTLREAVSIHEPALRDPKRRVEELLEQVGLPVEYAKRRPASLSGGERQRVAIARALAANPRVLVCDEPVSALDVSVQAQVLNLFLRLRRDRGLGYLFITHDLAIVRQMTDVLYVIHRGSIVESGPTDQVLDTPKAPYTVQLLKAIPGTPRP